MVNFLIVLGFLFSQIATAAYNPGAINTVTCGGATLSRTGLITLNGYTRSGNILTTLVRTDKNPAATGGYTPSGATVFRAVCIRHQVLAASGTAPSLGYGDTDTGMLSNGSVTNFKGVGASPSTGGTLLTASTVGVFEHFINFIVPNGKFLSIITSVGAQESNFIVYGYEE